MTMTREISDNVVFITFSDTHGSCDRLARIYTAIDETIKEDRAKNRNVKHVLLVPGDVMSVNALLSTLSEGKVDVNVVSETANLFDPNYRVLTPGNHDFSFEEPMLLKLIKDANFRVVVSNATFEDGSSVDPKKAKSHLPYEKLITLTIDGKSFTVGGLMTPETNNSESGKKVIRQIDGYPEEFKENPPTVLLSHLGSESDKALNSKAKILVGGHSHDREVKYDAKTERLFVNAGAGECIIVIRDGGKTPEIRLVSNYAPHKKIQAIFDAALQTYAPEFKKQFNFELATLSKPVFSIAPDSKTPSGLDAPSDMLTTEESHLRITDTMITRVTADGLKKALGVDIVLYPAAAIRSNFNKGQTATGVELFETYYFANTLVKITLTGNELIRLLALGVMSGLRCWQNRGKFLTPSAGLTYAYDAKAPNPGDTIQWVKWQGKFISPTDTFTVATTDWIANDTELALNPTQKLAYPADLKIFRVMLDYFSQLEHTVLSESYGERVFPAQALREQTLLMREPGNGRADKPNFVRALAPINYAQHRENSLMNLITDYAGTMFGKVRQDAIAANASLAPKDEKETVLTEAETAAAQTLLWTVMVKR